MKRNMIWTIVLLWATFVPSTNGEVYKWVDENGRTHYGEKPPAADAEEMKIKSSASPADSSGKSPEEINAERERLLKVYEEERQQKEEEKLEQENRQAELREKCMELENKLQDMKEGGAQYYRVDESGKRQYVSDEELQKRIQTMQELYNKEC